MKPRPSNVARRREHLRRCFVVFGKAGLRPAEDPTSEQKAATAAQPPYFMEPPRREEVLAFG